MTLASRIIVSLFLLSTILFSATNILQKARLEKGELHLLFSEPLNEKNVVHFRLNAPHREIYDFKNTHLAHHCIPSKLGANVRISKYNANTVRIVVLSDGSSNKGGYQPFFPENEYYIALPKQTSMPVVSAHKSNIKPLHKAKVAPVPYQNVPKIGILKDDNKLLDTPIPRNAGGAKLIVIDAGHGGHDAGAVVGGKKEKDVVLQIAKKLEQEFKKRGHPVHMTRSTDRFLALPQRTKIADQKDAAVFISVHANSVPAKKQTQVQGIETFFLQKTRDARSKRIAERENKSVLMGATQLSKNIILDSVISGPKIVQSNKLAIDVQRKMMRSVRGKYSGVKDGGVRHAPFWVLVGASRPSILIEVGYISHPVERQRLCDPHYQGLLAKGIAQGVDVYLYNRKKEIDF